jgi:hypothetical protein
LAYAESYPFPSLLCCNLLSLPAATTFAPGSSALIDHASYLGLDMNNDGCRSDLAFINAYTIEPGTLFGFNCITKKS